MSEASKDLYGKVLILKNFEKIKIIIVLASIPGYQLLILAMVEDDDQSR